MGANEKDSAVELTTASSLKISPSRVLRALRRTLKDPRHLGRIARKLQMIATRNSTFHSSEELGAASHCPAGMIDEMLEIFQPQSILDIGQGTGQAVAYFVGKGITDVVGVEGSPEAIRASPFPDKAFQWDLNRTLDLHRRFDIVYSFEVVEHIHPRFVDNLVQTFSAHGDRIVMTAAHPGQGGIGHFNEQPAEYWIGHFARLGYRYDEGNTKRLKDCRDLCWDNLLSFVREPGRPG